MFGKGITLFRIFGFTVRVDASWLLIAALIIWSLATGLFPYLYEDFPAMTYWWMGIAGLVGLFLSVVFHELSHSLVARLYGLRIKGITLFLFGGVAEAYEEPKEPRSEFFLAIAGPISSLVLAFIFYMFLFVGLLTGLHGPVQGVLSYLSTINIVLAVFNLLPGFPLDGGRVFRSALWYFKGDLRWATRIATNTGLWIGLAFIVMGVVSLFYGAFIGGMWWVLIGFFLRNAAKTSYQQMLVRQAFGEESVRRFMNPNPVTVSPSVSIQVLVVNYIYGYHHKMFPVVEGDRLVGCVSTGDVKSIPHDEWVLRTVGEIMQPCSMENTAGPDEWALGALTRMSRTGHDRLMVVDRGRLVGILTLKDLLELLAVRMKFGGEVSRGRPF